MTSKRSFAATVTADTRGRAVIAVPFDPDEVWGPKPEHRVGGHVGAARFRGSIERVDGGFAMRLGPAWLRDSGISAGDRVEVELFAEGPQRQDLPEDVRAAFDATPDAGSFFDGLAQFYRKAYLRYIEATKRRPDERVRRIDEVVSLCRRKIKERPK